MKNTSSQPEKISSGTNSSFWVESVAAIAYSKLSSDKECDVVIVGGGISGVSIAYSLSKLGQKVILVEDGNIGSGETGRTTAHLVTALDDRYYDLERMHGKEDTRLIAQSHRMAIDYVEQTIAEEGFGCQFKRVDGYLFLHPSDNKDSLDKELAAAFEAGADVEQLTRVPGMKHIEGGCIRFKNQARFHPLMYLDGLCKAAVARGAEIYTETHAKKIDHTGIVTDEGHTIKARHVVVATNTPVNNLVGMHLKQFPYRTYVIGALVKKDEVPEALWWDTGDYKVNENIPPYHYVRMEPFNEMFDMLIVGGEDHATGLAEAEVVPEENRYAILETWARHFFPITEVVYRWSGQVLEPMDGVAFIGRNTMDKNNVYIVTGDSGNGMTHGTIAGILIPDLILGRKNDWEKIYNPSRLKLFKAGKTMLSEVVGGLRKYFDTKPKHPESVALNSIKPGEGKIIEMEGKQYGCYCDDEENLHFVDAECTHLKCIVKWNNDEKSWDCPCHGSRFTYEGGVLNGPANKPLDYHKEPVAQKDPH